MAFQGWWTCFTIGVRITKQSFQGPVKAFSCHWYPSMNSFFGMRNWNLFTWNILIWTIITAVDVRRINKDRSYNNDNGLVLCLGPESALHWLHYSFRPHSHWWWKYAKPRLPWKGKTDDSLAANQHQTAPLTTTVTSTHILVRQCGYSEWRGICTANPLAVGQPALLSEPQSPQIIIRQNGCSDYCATDIFCFLFPSCFYWKPRRDVDSAPLVFVFHSRK